ncbi:type I-E CRISPR-associated protein Cse2/CasB [Nocardiopsis gilva YIM 90087]|uniref:Type I-E CRISPR-associated protein Cse2/CasB n=2 Tax=Nocardiopsis gilva TaxID=280236 RepID=A0A223S984_9ACTN|nr:type I-E CRISPR-associated protein Cse2/CasB [Nocardiopsis gilva YIM 90087]
MRDLIGELYLKEGGLTRDAPGTLARWRRALGRTTQQSPVLSMEIARVIGTGENDGREPHLDAIHHSLALLAAHQQSASQPMHHDHGSASLGAQCRELCRRVQAEQASGSGREKKDPRGPQYADESKGVVRRLEAAVSARSVKELVGHVRGLVPMLRKAELPLDYVRLAAEFDAWASPNRRGRVARRWGTDFYRPFPKPQDAAPSSSS